MIDHETFQIADCAPDPIVAECEIYFCPAHLRTSNEPEITLKRVTFADGSEAERDSDHARLVALRFGDRDWSEHLPWPDIELRCREQYARGMGGVCAVIGETLRNFAASAGAQAATAPESREGSGADIFDFPATGSETAIKSASNGGRNVTAGDVTSPGEQRAHFSKAREPFRHTRPGEILCEKCGCWHPLELGCATKEAA